MAGSVTMSRLAVSATSVSATFALTQTSGTAVSIAFPAGITGTAATATASCTATSATTPIVIDCSTVPASIVVTGLTNPAAAGSVNFAVTMTGETGTFLMNVPFVDSDLVNVTGYINTSLAFDIDTTTPASSTFAATTVSTDPLMCTKTACLAYEGGAVASNYTVDLGNLVAGTANISGSSYMHAAGSTGNVNFIYLHLTTNAASGASVTYRSLNAALNRNVNTTNVADVTYDIPSIASAGTLSAVVTAAGHAYGIKEAAAPSTVAAGTSYVYAPIAACNNTASAGIATTNVWCTMPKTATTLFSTGSSVQGLRTTWALGAVANGTNPAETYTDQLTFVATATY